MFEHTSALPLKEETAEENKEEKKKVEEDMHILNDMVESMKHIEVSRLFPVRKCSLTEQHILQQVQTNNKQFTTILKKH